MGLGENDIQDSDGDGVIDSEDYAPQDPDVQEKSDIIEDTPTESPTGTPTNTATESPTPTPTAKPCIDAEIKDITWDNLIFHKAVDVEIANHSDREGTITLEIKMWNNDNHELLLDSVKRKVTLPPTSQDTYVFDDYDQESGTEDITVEIINECG